MIILIILCMLAGNHHVKYSQAFFVCGFFPSYLISISLMFKAA